MRSWPLAAASVLALAAAGCNLLPKPQRAVTRLTCPATEGVLTRVSIAPNGKTCSYSTAQGARVELRLVPVKNGVPATLAALEGEALALRPPTAVPDSAAQDASPSRAARSTEPEDAAQADDDGADDDVDIDLPGLHIRTQGDAARIRLGGLQVDAGGEGAVVRKTWDVRLRGEATSHEKRGVRALFIKVDNGHGGSGVGYQVAGPKAGPLTVALVQWSHGDSEDLYEDVRKLVRDNGGA